MPSNVSPRGNRFIARAQINGKSLWLGSYETPELARRAVRDAKANAKRGEPPPQRFNVRTWHEQWQRLYPGKRGAETAEHNRIMCEPFVRRHGKRDLRSITPLEAQAHALVSPGSVRYLRLMWSKAVKAGLADSNPWLSVEVTPERRALVVLTLEDVLRLERVAAARDGYGPHLADLVMFTAFTGLRLSEVSDVRASDVREDGRRLLVRGKRRAGEIAPRERVVAVLAPARVALLRQAPEVGLVWHSPTGKRLTRESIGRVFGSLTRDAGLAGATFHALRHFHASHLVDLGADRADVAAQLGHVDAHGRPYPELVDRVYAHPNPEAALKRLEAVAG